MNITRNQWLQIFAVILGANVAASSLWTQLFGQNVAAIIISFLGLGNTILAGVTYVLTGQGQTVRDVLAMPGVNEVAVNSQANKTLATIAIDPTQHKIKPTTADAMYVDKIAKGE